MTEYANILLAVRAEQTRRLPVAIIACSTPSSKLMALILSLRFYSQRPYCNPKPQAVAFSRLMNLPWNSIVRYQDSSEGLAEAKEKGHKDSGGGGDRGFVIFLLTFFFFKEIADAKYWIAMLLVVTPFRSVARLPPSYLRLGGAGLIVAGCLALQIVQEVWCGVRIGARSPSSSSSVAPCSEDLGRSATSGALAGLGKQASELSVIISSQRRRSSFKQNYTILYYKQYYITINVQYKTRLYYTALYSTVITG